MSTTRVDGSRLPRRRVDGVLLLDKPTGLTSNAALRRAKRLHRAEKAGHTGTLDPLASGLLPSCFGEATKFAQSLLDARKEYVATLRFGIATSTGDSEGATIAKSAAEFSRPELERALVQFVGSIQQVPPRHAALKHEERAHYEYPRAGVEIPRVPRDVHIGAIEILAFSLPTITLRVECGKGTYIRVLAPRRPDSARAAESVRDRGGGHDYRRDGQRRVSTRGATEGDRTIASVAEARAPAIFRVRRQRSWFLTSCPAGPLSSASSSP